MMYNRYMRLNVSLPVQLKLDLATYCDKNGLQLAELVRILIKKEIYNERTQELKRKGVAL